MKNKKVLILSHELAPFCQETEISQRLGDLVKETEDGNNLEFRAIVPRFGLINERKNRLHEVIRLSGNSIRVNNTDNLLKIKFASVPNLKMQVYFLENEDYFNRKAIFKSTKKTFYKDNDERMIFYCKGVVEVYKKLGWKADYIICNDWFCGLVPFYLKQYLKDELANTKILYLLSGYEFEEKLNLKFTQKVFEGLDNVEAQQNDFGNDYHSIISGGIKHSDQVLCFSKDVTKKSINIAEKLNDNVIPFEENITKELVQKIIMSN